MIKTSLSKILLGACCLALASPPVLAQAVGDTCQNINGRNVKVERVGGNFRPVLVNGDMVDCATAPDASLSPGLVYVVVGGVVVGAIAAAVVAASSGGRSNTNLPYISP